MKTKNITLSPEAITAIEGLQHNCGTYSFYIDTLSRLYNYILAQSDEIGMDDTETLHTLRALHFLKIDLACISGRTRTPITHTPATDEETAERVEETFEDLQDSDDPAPVDKLDEPREMLADVKRAWQKIFELQTVISEAITHAQNAGEKYKSVISDLADINVDLDNSVAALDAIMAIDPDTYEPREPTYMEKTVKSLLRSLDAITAAKEYLDDAVDQAARSEEISDTMRLLIESARELTNNTVKEVAVLATGETNSKEDCYRLPT